MFKDDKLVDSSVFSYINGDNDSYSSKYDINIHEEWDYVCCECCKIAYFPQRNFLICNHWIPNYLYIFIFLTTLISSALLIVYDCEKFYFLKQNNDVTIDFYNKNKLGSNIIDALTSRYCIYSVLCFVLLCVLMSYLLIIMKGPGYVPYNWCQTRRMNYDFNYMMSNLAFTDQQYSFALNSDHPERSYFSKKMKRYILKADHYCYWSSSWIGANNFRFFILFLIWYLLYDIFYIVIHIKFVLIMVKMFKTNNFDKLLYMVPGFIYLFAYLILSVLVSYHLFQGVYKIVKNRTQLEIWSNIYPVLPQRTVIENCELSCGHKKFMLFWIFPFCTFFQPKDNGFL